jgi:hypothetical protein
MNTISRSILIGGALVLVLVGCQKKDESDVASGVRPSATGTSNAAPTAPTATPDRSVPDVTGKAAATQDTTALQQKAAPQEKMTKEEESKAMPLPSQANDHSTTALDKNKKK